MFDLKGRFRLFGVKVPECPLQNHGRALSSQQEKQSYVWKYDYNQGIEENFRYAMHLKVISTALGLQQRWGLFHTATFSQKVYVSADSSVLMEIAITARSGSPFISFAMT